MSSMTSTPDDVIDSPVIVAAAQASVTTSDHQPGDGSGGSLVVDWAWTLMFMKENREHLALYSILAAAAGAVCLLVVAIFFLLIIRPRQGSSRLRRPTADEPTKEPSPPLAVASTQTSPAPYYHGGLYPGSESAFLLPLSSTDNGRPRAIQQQPYSPTADGGLVSTSSNGLRPGAVGSTVGPTRSCLRSTNSTTNRSPSSSDETATTTVLSSPSMTLSSDGEATVRIRDGTLGASPATSPVRAQVCPSPDSPDWAELGALLDQSSDSQQRLSRSTAADLYTNPYRHDTCRTIDSRSSSRRK